MALGMAAAAGAALLGGSAASAAADDGDAPAQKDPEPEALAALRAELAASRQLLSNANVLAEEYKQAAQKIAAAAEEKEAKRRAAFEEEVAAAKVSGGKRESQTCCRNSPYNCAQMRVASLSSSDYASFQPAGCRPRCSLRLGGPGGRARRRRVEAG